VSNPRNLAPNDLAASPLALGRRVVIVGSSCSGKSTLGERLAALADVPFVEMDALFWKPNWTESSDEEFQARLCTAAAADAWVMSGNYSRHTAKGVWPRAETIVWLDLPLRITLWRIVTRSWRRWRKRELLWGTNHESFFRQFELWSKESLITYSIATKRRKDRHLLEAMTDPRWAHIRFIRLCSPAEISAFVASLEAGARTE
jgi:adenylate kinase family enzyme